jgi:hypothetical protein
VNNLYYLQDTRQYVGNCILFWANPSGYTCDLDKAAVFSKEEAYAQHRSRKSDKPLLKSKVDKAAVRHVDIQLLRK